MGKCPLASMLNAHGDWGRNTCLLLNASKTKSMVIVIEKKDQLHTLIDPALFNAGNRQIRCVYKRCII